MESSTGSRLWLLPLLPARTVPGLRFCRMQQKRKEGSGPKRTPQGLEGWTSELGALPHAASTPKATVAAVPVHLLPSVKLQWK